jgi:hypothetical protein
MKISVVIVNHNTPKLVRDCLASLRRYLKMPLEVIVVNNGADRYRGAREAVIDLGDNPGFGASNNVGAGQATGNILWFLNSDTLLADDSIEKVFEYVARHEDAGIVTPLLYRDAKCHTLQSDFYAKRQTLGTLLTRRAKPKINLKSGDFMPVDVVVGASMVARREVFEKLGGFDERIFMYLEDDDLCYRARKAGYRVGIYTGARVVHWRGGSIRSHRQRKRLYYQSQNYFWRKHYGIMAMWLMRMIRWPLKCVKTI